jgi:hypothetical protein
MRRVLLLFVLLGLLAAPVDAFARGPGLAFTGGTPAEQAQVRAALNVSSFPWEILPQTIQVHVARGVDSYATPGQVVLDADLLDAGRFSWGTVQHEFGHQVDFLLVDDATRATLATALGGRAWYYAGDPGAAHGEYGCERFASTLAWSYWQSPDNAMKPATTHDESAAMAPAQFRALLAELIGVHPVAAAPANTKAFAPKRKRTK